MEPKKNSLRKKIDVLTKLEKESQIFSVDEVESFYFISLSKLLKQFPLSNRGKQNT